jgi:hypothetical protein
MLTVRYDGGTPLGFQQVAQGTSAFFPPSLVDDTVAPARRLRSSSFLSSRQVSPIPVLGTSQSMSILEVVDYYRGG